MCGSPRTVTTGFQPVSTGRLESNKSAWGLRQQLLAHASDTQKWHAGEHIENTLEALTALIQRDNSTPEGLPSLAYIEFDVHVRLPDLTVALLQMQL